jgi:hypothetical protein
MGFKGIRVQVKIRGCPIIHSNARRLNEPLAPRSNSISLWRLCLRSDRNSHDRSFPTLAAHFQAAIQPADSLAHGPQA